MPIAAMSDTKEQKKGEILIRSTRKTLKTRYSTFKLNTP